MKKEDLSILVVEDEKDICQCLAHFFKQINFKNVVFCYDGNDAIKKINNSNYDIAIIDFLLPNGITGKEIFEKIIEKKDTVVLMMSGKIDIDDNFYINNGAINFIRKPFDLSILLSLFDFVIQIKNSMDDLIKNLLIKCPNNKTSKECVLYNFRLKKNNKCILQDLSKSEKQKILYSHHRCENSI